MVPWLVLAGVMLAPSAGFLLWSWRAAAQRYGPDARHRDHAGGRRRQAAARKPGRGQRPAALRRAGDRGSVEKPLRPFRRHRRARLRDRAI